jgi:hypothetical protein
MTESIPATWNDDRDAAFFGITDALTLAGFDVAARFEKMLKDMAGAESWESMALRSVARSAPRSRELVPVPAPIAAPAVPRRPNA